MIFALERSKAFPLRKSSPGFDRESLHAASDGSTLPSDAERELEAASIEYGDALVGEVAAAVDRAQATPSTGAPWPKFSEETGVRRRKIQSFRYLSLAYVVIGPIP